MEKMKTDLNKWILQGKGNTYLFSRKGKVGKARSVR